MSRPLPTPEAFRARFWSHVAVGEPEACWPWKLARLPPWGYGRTAWPGRAGRDDLAHRMVWALTNGDVPPGLIVRHRCDNPPCCNPAHLLLGTPLDNSRDIYERGRDPRPRKPREPAARAAVRGSAHGGAKLHEQAVVAMRQRRAAGEPLRDLAAVFGISVVTASKVCLRQAWSHVR